MSRLLAALGVAVAWLAGAPEAPVFVVRPYLQAGCSARPGEPAGLTVAWHSPDTPEAQWSLEVKRRRDGRWEPCPRPEHRRVAVGGIAPYRVWWAEARGLEPGRAFQYRVLRNGRAVAAASARAPKRRGQPSRFAILGDCGAGTSGQRRIAYQAWRQHPDYIFIPGDIVYGRGRVSEYRDNFWPVYLAARESPATGAPLMASTLFLAAPGNHDMGARDLGQYPDGLGYFLHWIQPLNGPPLSDGAPGTPRLEGPESARQAFRSAAGPAYPRMASFSYDYGDVHWTVIDSNPYLNWDEPALRRWLEQDIQRSGAAWKIVGFHHPGFNSSKSHFGDQWMRAQAPVFERAGADLVVSGHVHNYQRTHPLRFTPRTVGQAGTVTGDLSIDRGFDGSDRTRPRGVIYLISGAGGAGLYNPEQQHRPWTWQPFTARFFSEKHSFTIVEADAERLEIRQIDADGDEVDRFTITKTGPMSEVRRTAYPRCLSRRVRTGS